MYKLHSHLYVRWIFLRIVSLCFLTAFISLAVQITGLYGEHGIIPLQILTGHVDNLNDKLLYPSIYWFNCSDAFLSLSCWIGAAASLLAFSGICTGASIFSCWFLYLSIVSVGQVFMSFQWDLLLLETGLLTALFAPWKLKERHPFHNRKVFEEQNEPSYIFLFLIRLLCFKLMIFSGVCKLASHDPSWHDLSAMTYHYETQPLPTPLAWLTHKLPLLFQQASTIVMFFIELVLPAVLLVFWRKARLFAAVGFVLLQVLIMSTGNYAFFNWLTIALGISLLDDKSVFALMPNSIKVLYKDRWRSLREITFNTIFTSVIGIYFGIAAIGCISILSLGKERTPEILQLPLVLMQPLRSFNGYGLFAVMTRSRPEIIIEGSDDGKTWLAYEFKYKPGDIKRAPPLVAPHQPRLDWQMWFASLGSERDNPWFDYFVIRLLQGSPEVLMLLETNPFPEKAPKFIRAETYDYHFSDFNTLINKGEWWVRQRKESYFPASSLEDIQYLRSR